MTIYEKYQQATAQYLASLKIVSNSAATYDKYAFVLADFGEYIKAHDAEQPEVDPMLIVGWRNQLKEDRGLENNSIRHYLTLVHSFFRWTIEHKVFAEQPVNSGDYPKRESVEYDLLTEQEIEQILTGKLPRYAQHNTCVRNRALIIMVLTSGVRVSELIDLRVDDLDFDKHIIAVRHGKGNKKRSVTFPAIAEKYIKEYLNSRYGSTSAPKQALLFDNTDDNGTPHKFTRQNITRLVKSYVYHLTGHENIGTHDLRHSYASYMLTHGVPIQEIQALLGHENYSTTLIYASQLCPERVATNLNAVFAAHIGAAS